MKIENLKWDNRETGDTPLRQMQLVGVRLLKVLDQVCRENNIEYMLFWGTLLGAVRHKGFIPWDDDIDVWMSPADLKKFVAIADSVLPEDVYVRVLTREKVKICDAYSTVVEGEESTADGKGISLDIFAYGEYPRYFPGLKLLQHCIMVTSWYCNADCGSFKVKLGRWISLIVNPVFETLWWMLLKILPTPLLGTAPQSGSPKRFVRYERSEIFPLSRVRFEDGEFACPANPDAVLKKLYGDYMKIPRRENQIPHSSTILPFSKCNHSRAMEWPRDRKEVI